MKVYLVWVNDSVIGVYADEAKAKTRALEYREKDTDHPWHQSRGGRWFQKWAGTGRGPTVARLEIEEREVQ